MEAARTHEFLDIAADVNRGPSPAMQRAFDAIEARARRTAFHTVKQRARQLGKRPDHLELIQPRLSAAGPDKLIHVGRALLMGERAVPISRTDLMVPVKAVNARAVMILGRWRRRFERQMSEAA